jgi:hypothetical protein
MSLRRCWSSSRPCWVVRNAAKTVSRAHGRGWSLMYTAMTSRLTTRRTNVTQDGPRSAAGAKGRVVGAEFDQLVALLKLVL